MLPSHTHSYFRSGIFDLADNASYDVRIEGAAAGDQVRHATAADINNDGKRDLLISASGADFNGRTDSGSLYIIYSTTLDDAIRRNGQQFTLADNRNWNIRIDGAAASDIFTRSVVVDDIDNDGKSDIIASANGADNNSRSGSGSIYILYNTLPAAYSGTGNVIDLAQSTSYNLRYDGPAASTEFGRLNVVTADIDNDGKKDLVAAAYAADYNSRSNSGSIYIIYNTLIDDYAGTGNAIDLATTTNFNIRIDGAVASDTLGIGNTTTGDFDSDGKTDLVISTNVADPNSKTDAGTAYLLYNTLLDDYSNTGNTIDLLTSTNYSVKYNGASANDQLQVGIGDVSADIDNDSKADLVLTARRAGYLYIIPNTFTDDYAGTAGTTVDLGTTTNYRLRIDGTAAIGFGTPAHLVDTNNDGKNDLVITTQSASFNGRSAAGGVYIVDNGIINAYTGSGNTLDITQPSNFSTRWDGAQAGDGAGGAVHFNNYDINNDSLIDIFFAAQNGGPRSAGVGAGYLYIIYGRPNSTSSVVGIKQTVPDLHANEGGIVGGDNVVMVVEGETFAWDSYVYRERTEKSAVSPVSFTSEGFLFSQISPVYYIVWRAFSNDAKIIEAAKPFIVSLNYHPEDIGTFSEGQFKLAYSMDKQNWKILPNSVVNTTNTNVATTTTQTEGYYVIVAGVPTGIASTSSAPILGEHTIASPAPPSSLMPGVTPEPSASSVPFETERTKRCILWWCW